MSPRTLWISLFLVALSTGCSAHRVSQRADLEPLRFEAELLPSPGLVENHFARDRTNVGENELRQILAAPVFLEEHARIGVLTVSTQYAVEPELPVSPVPTALTEALAQSGIFELATEVSNDWPIAPGVAGLRELAARYRTEYLLLYRHRFVEQERANGWAWTYLTLIGAFLAPGTTVEATGVLEATLFDVKTGTLLFTVQERVRGDTMETLFNQERQRQLLRQQLTTQSAARLADLTLMQCRQLVAARSRAGGDPKGAVSVGPDL